MSKTPERPFPTVREAWRAAKAHADETAPAHRDGFYLPSREAKQKEAHRRAHWGYLVAAGIEDTPTNREELRRELQSAFTFGASYKPARRMDCETWEAILPGFEHFAKSSRTLYSVILDAILRP